MPLCAEIYYTLRYMGGTLKQPQLLKNMLGFAMSIIFSQFKYNSNISESIICFVFRTCNVFEFLEPEH